MARALGRYELLRPLARGGMAEVYLARRRAAGIEKWLVVKRMRPERSGDPRFLDLFVREARLSMSLAHQNIVPVFDFGRIDDQVFLAMERVEGKDLGSSLARAAERRVPPLLAAFIAAECCQALDYAHQRKAPDGVALGIVHRDVTPRNVLLSWSGEVKLTDFGIAALAGDATSRLLGTPQYMAPEQARSEPIDPRADIYAIGLVLREAVSGVRSRPGGDRDAILEAARRGDLVPWPHLHAPPPPAADGALAEPADEPPPAALVAIIERATALAATDRYADARTMLADLDAFMVIERAARKAESPARQLAAWLAAVWEGARDDIETDAAIHAEHLVSFIDDGAVDVIGTGTVRSLAGTAADDVQGEPHAAAAAAALAGTTTAPAAGATTAPAAVPRLKPKVVVEPDAVPPAKPAVVPVPGIRADGGRISRISSSTTTVASGSFHTLPSGDVRRAGWPRDRRARSISSFARLVLVAVAAGAIVFWVMSARHERGPSRETAAHPGSAQPGSAQAGTAQPDAAQSGSARPAAPPPAIEPPVSGSGAPPASGSKPGSPNPGRPTPSRAATGASPPGHAGTAPQPTRSPAGSPGRATGADRADAGSDAIDRGSSDPPRPQTCKVRINLTPWAYYTADDDSTRHETPGTIDLTPGRHRLHVWNPELHVERDIIITVPADRDAMNYSEPLQPTSLPHDAGVH